MKLPVTFTVLCPDYESAKQLKDLCVVENIPNTELELEHTNMLRPEVYLHLKDITYKSQLKEIMNNHKDLYVHDAEDEIRKGLEKLYNK